MTRFPAPSGHYAGVLPADFRAHLLAHLVEYGAPIEETPEGIEVTFGAARVNLRLAASDFAVEFRGADAVQLHHLREMTLYLLDHLHPKAAAGILWQGFEARPGTPPDFHLARLAAKERLSPGFLRLWLDCDGTAALASGPMHFSLLLPPAGEEPVWPRLDDTGRTVWPKGRAALHRAPYTFVTLDPVAGRFAFDIFLHAGSRTSDWAVAAEPGAVVGVTGPGGGSFPPGKNLLLAGDETALPAIRRILEQSDPERVCTVLIETGDPADRLLAAAPAHGSLRWLDRSRGENLWQALHETPVPQEDRFVWVAAEQQLARRAKEHFRKTAALKPTEGYFSAYWAAASSGK